MKKLTKICVILFLSIASVMAQKEFPFLKKERDGVVQPLKTTAVLTAGNWEFWANYNGMLAYNTLQGKSGGIFPKNTAMVLDMQGILWGAWLKDAQTGQKIADNPLRVGGVYYRSGLQPGWIQSNGQAVDVNNPKVKVYFVRKDWRTLSDKQLLEEAAIYFGVDSLSVKPEMTAQLKEALAENWKNWPVDLGAPYNDVNGNGIYDPVFDAQGYPDAERGDYPGIAQADQVIWFVANDLDEATVEQLSGVPSIGMELQVTLWTFKGEFTPLSQTIFIRYRLINKSPYLLDSMFVAIAGDQDIGYYGDDLAGCDPKHNMWFAYNGKSFDKEYAKYGLMPPALGYSLLSGPTDTLQSAAWEADRTLIGQKQILSSFFSFRSGESFGPPPMGQTDFTFGWYNIMRGFVPTIDLQHPRPWIVGSGPFKGQPTRFPLSGDAVNDPGGIAGDVDGAGNNLGPGSRSMSGNVGPFSLAPGAQQDILLAISGGMGTDNRNAIVQLQAINRLLNAYRLSAFESFEYAPAPPKVTGTSFVDDSNQTSVVLNWGWDTNRIHETEEKKFGDFKFEGYNVYQLPSAQSAVTDPGVKKVATFDVQDGIYTVLGWRYISELNRFMLVPLFTGRDSGIQRHLIIKKDALHHQPFFKGATYYFAVTAYNYDSKGNGLLGYESEPTIVKVTVRGPKPGERFEADLGDTLSVNINMKSDVICKVTVVDPSKTTGHDYEISFDKNNDSSASTYGQWVWNLTDKTSNQVLLRGQPITAVRNVFERRNEISIDGLGIYVQLPSMDMPLKAIVEVANGKGPLPKSEWDDLGRPYAGNNVWQSFSAPSDENRFLLSTSPAENSYFAFQYIARDVQNANFHDFEMRFTEKGGVYYWWADAGNFWSVVPFEFWDVGYGTYQDTTDDVRCITGGYSGGATPGIFDFGYTDPYFGYPATDWIFVRKPTDSLGSYQAFVQDVSSGTFGRKWWKHSLPVLDNLIICDVGGKRTLPEKGTVIRFILVKGPRKDLKFSFTAPGHIENNLKLAKQDIRNINVFPNPYYAGTALGPNVPVDYVTFTHLPKHAILRIFTLNGDLVYRIEKNEESPFCRWNLMNSKGKRIASGLYIVRVEMPELKESKNLKLMVIMEGE